MTRSWQDNAAEFGALTTQGKDLRLALLVACSVEKGAGQGKRSEPLNDHSEVVKVSGAEFARKAKTGHPRILHHLAAWDRFAELVGLPLAADLTPGDALTIAISEDQAQVWEDEMLLQPERPNGQTGGTTIDRIIANPDKVAQAIAESPALAKAVALDREASLAVFREENLARQAATPPRPPRVPHEEPTSAFDLLAIGGIIEDLRTFVTALAKVDTEGKAFTDTVKAMVNGYADEGIALLGNAKAIVEGEMRTHLTDDDLDALLSGGQA